MVPHLITALTNPINELEQHILDAMPAIERWFRLEWMEHTPPFYCGIDIRNSGYKLAPVDTNLFPGGWNNLTEEMLPLAVQAAQAVIEKTCPDAKNLLIIPRNHGHNSFYLSNLKQLERIFSQVGLTVRIGSIDPSLKQAKTVRLPSSESITLEPAMREGRRLVLPQFDPCTILLNNDLLAGAPGILEELPEQHLLPPLHAGASVRHRVHHYRAYEEVAKRFSKLLGMDPWLIHPLFEVCHGLRHDEDSTEPHHADSDAQILDCLQGHADSLLSKIRKKYKEYGVHERPFVIIKADCGFSGTGIVRIHDAKDLGQALTDLSHNSKGQAMPAKTLSELLPREIVLQEGIYTNEQINDAVAEPVVYTMDRFVVGGFYRVHSAQGPDENLAAPGAAYIPLAFDHAGTLPQSGARPGASSPNRFYMYGVIARLSMLAASYELESADPMFEGDL